MQYLLTKEELERDYVPIEMYEAMEKSRNRKDDSNDAWWKAVEQEESQEIRDRIYARKDAIFKEKRNHDSMRKE